MGAVKGQDDLDVDGNWEPLEPLRSEAFGQKRSEKKKRKLAAPEQSMKGMAVEDDDGDQGLAPEGKAKSKRKKRRRLQMEGVNPAAGGRNPSDLLAASWAAEAKSLSLSTIEVGEVVPEPNWFMSRSSSCPLSKLPSTLRKPEFSMSESPSSGASVIVLSASTERVFEVVAEIESSWKTKPVVLAAHGGGRKKDQIARQAEALKRGAAVAVATPGRLLRLLDGDHASLRETNLVVIELTRDRKNRDVLTLPETRRDVFALLRRHALKRVKAESGGIRLLLCGAAATTD